MTKTAHGRASSSTGSSSCGGSSSNGGEAAEVGLEVPVAPAVAGRLPGGGASDSGGSSSAPATTADPGLLPPPELREWVSSGEPRGSVSPPTSPPPAALLLLLHHPLLLLCLGIQAEHKPLGPHAQGQEQDDAKPAVQDLEERHHVGQVAL